MARQATGQLFSSRGRYFVRVRVGDERPAYALRPGIDRPAAEARKAFLAEVAHLLRKSPEVATKLLERAARADDHELPGIRRFVDSVASGARAPSASKGAETTVGDLAEELLNGDLARRYPDRVKVPRSLPAIRSRLENHILPALGPEGIPIRDVRLVDFQLDHGEAVLANLPDHLEHETRRHVARLLKRLLNIAVYPKRLILASPLPRGWVPAAGAQKALQWIYPDEDLQLMRCADVPLGWRMFWAFLDREGCRASEAWSLELPEIDLARGAITLDKNKTDDPRAWALAPGVATAISRYLAIRGFESSYVFCDDAGVPIATRDPSYLATRFRRHLQIAGVTRPELFEKSSARLPIRAHDLRGAFVTIASANGRSEAWIMDRTGHGTSAMLNRYRRAIRKAHELDLGDWTRLDEALPELRAVDGRPVPPAAARMGSGMGSTTGEESQNGRQTQGVPAPGPMAMSAMRSYQGGPGSSRGAEEGSLAAPAQRWAT